MGSWRHREQGAVDGRGVLSHPSVTVPTGKGLQLCHLPYISDNPGTTGLSPEAFIQTPAVRYMWSLRSMPLVPLQELASSGSMSW